MANLVGKMFMHYSGKGPYRVLHIASSTKDLSRWVAYEQLYDHVENDKVVFAKGHVWSRPIEEFTGTVDGVSRFTLVPSKT